MKPVPLLARIRVATPCRADWNQMTGDERVRHCAQCKKDVFNLSDMTREQAERLIIEKNGDLCARYYQRHDGTILLADCSVGLAQKRTTRAVAAGALALLAGTPVAALSLRTKAHVPAEPQVRITGVVEIEVPPPAPPTEATEIMGGMPPPIEVEQVKPARAAASKRLGKRPSKASSPVDIDE